MHSHHGHHHHTPTHRIKIAFFLNLTFAVIEIVASFLTGSFAILADAVHDFGDSLTLGLAWILQRLSEKKPTTAFTYGYRRLSLFSSLITAVVLMGGIAYVLTHAYQNFLSPKPIHGWGMLGFAILGVVVNGYAAYSLSHGKTMNERVLTWHLVEDVLGWAAVLIGSILILTLQWYWIDSVLAVAISLYIFWNVVKILITTVRLFLQTAPHDIDTEDLKTKILAVNGIVNIHDIHFWSLDGERHILTLHVIAKDSILDTSEIKKDLRNLFKSFGKIHSTIEIERESETCLEDLDDHH